MTFTSRDKQREALREIGQRRRVYFRLVSEGRMKADDAEQRIQIMSEIANDYGRLVDDAAAKQGKLFKDGGAA